PGRAAPAGSPPGPRGRPQPRASAAAPRRRPARPATARPRTRDFGFWILDFGLVQSSSVVHRLSSIVYRLPIQRQQFSQGRVVQGGEGGLADPDDLGGQGALAFDKLVDALVERAGRDQLVDLHIGALADAEGAVRRLVLAGR